jgi:hypothetical protein
MARRALSEEEKRQSVSFTTQGKNLQALDNVITRLNKKIAAGNYAIITRQSIMEGLLLEFLDKQDEIEKKAKKIKEESKKFWEERKKPRE